MNENQQKENANKPGNQNMNPKNAVSPNKRNPNTGEQNEEKEVPGQNQDNPREYSVSKTGGGKSQGTQNSPAENQASDR